MPLLALSTTYPVLVTYGVLASTAVTNSGATQVQGNVGVSGAVQTSITGFPPGTATGILEGTDTPGSTTIAADTELDQMITIINSMAPGTLIAAELGGQTLTPGTYSPIAGSFTLNGTLTLSGGPTDEFIFIESSTFIFAGTSQAIINYGTVDPKNIYWFAGSQITVTPSIPSSSLVGYLVSKGSITMGYGTNDFGGVYARTGTVTLDTNIITQAVVCYAEGTKIFTKRGNVPIEELNEDDMVLSMGNIDDLDHATKSAWKPIVWISKFTTSSKMKEGCPIRIKARAFGVAPFEDLYVSPRHRIVVKDKLVEAMTLVNGRTITQEYEHKHVTYYHIELDTHSSIFANGLLSESFLDVNNRKTFESSPKYVTPMIVS